MIRGSLITKEFLPEWKMSLMLMRALKAGDTDVIINM